MLTLSTRPVAVLCAAAGVLASLDSAEACHRRGHYGGYQQSAYYVQPVYARPAYVVPHYSPVVYPVQSAVSMPMQPTTAALVAQAKQCLKARDFITAQEAINVAVRREPKNAALLQLSSLISFARSDFQTSAATAYSGLTLGQAFDWSVVQQLYPSTAEYTDQYHQLTAAAEEKPDQAQLQFLAAYHHLMLGHQAEGRKSLMQAQKKLPQDKFIPLLLSQLREVPAMPAAPMPESLAADDTPPTAK